MKRVFIRHATLFWPCPESPPTYIINIFLPMTNIQIEKLGYRSYPFSLALSYTINLYDGLAYTHDLNESTIGLFYKINSWDVNRKTYKCSSNIKIKLAQDVTKRAFIKVKVEGILLLGSDYWRKLLTVGCALRFADKYVTCQVCCITLVSFFNIPVYWYNNYTSAGKNLVQVHLKGLANAKRVGFKLGVLQNFVSYFRMKNWSDKLLTLVYANITWRHCQHEDY